MTEPTAPQIPADAPQDVKDFFDCRGNTLVWRSGEVSWLGLKVTPTVDFAPGVNGSVTIRVSILGGMVSFDLPASVNAAGELVVDASSVPDLSDWGVGGRADIDAAIKRINDWFKHNGKKLRPATLRNGAVTLEKTPIGTAAATAVPVVPQPPVSPTPSTPKTTPVVPVTPPSQTPSGGGCSLLGGLLVLMLFSAIALGAGVGFVYFGGPGPAAQASATPSASPIASPTTSPAPSPTTTVAASLTAGASATPTVAPTPSPAASATATPGPLVAAACVRVVHQAVGDFISYLDWYVYLSDEDIDYLEVVVEGANNDEPIDLQFDTASGAYYGILGLHAAGAKKILSATVVLEDGTEIDVTDDLAHALGGKTLVVRYPQQDSFGDCMTYGTPQH